jgi:hypothetical protein
VTGATGGLGSDVVDQLLRLAPASELWVSVRRFEAAQNLAAEGLHHHSTNPTIIGCSQAGAGIGKADAGCLLLTGSGPSGVRFRSRHREAPPGARTSRARRAFLTKSYIEIAGRKGAVFSTAIHGNHCPTLLLVTLGPPASWISRIIFWRILSPSKSFS